MTPARPVVGVVGTGGIGAGVCVDLVVHGYEVIAVDRDPAALSATEDLLTQVARFLPAVRPDVPRTSLAQARERLRTSTEVAALSSCSLVVENITEDPEAKRALYRALDGVLPADAIIAVNTSSIPVGDLAAETGRAGLVVGLHLMNPSYLTTAVEVMRSDKTSDECMQRVRDLLDGLGKRAIVVGDFPGFVSNRISHLFFNEAMRVVQDQGVEPAVVDEVFTSCFGHTMGPLATADLIGLDTVALTLDNLLASYGDERYRGCALLAEKVAAGELGRKTGRGFYDYRPTAAKTTGA
jgi:3-hydroxybutyryl-CoA dehydrogenase